jgi:carboxypeptidase PM20D1
MFKTILKLVGAVLLILIAVQAYNTLRYAPQKTAITAVELPAVNETGVAERLGEAIRMQTISTATDMGTRGPEFQQFIDWLVSTYPNANAAMTRVIVGGLTPVYRWQGSDAALKPILLTAHYDVVPVAESGVEYWPHGPFSGAVADGFIWGRGALDDKSAVVAIMEAIEDLSKSGFTPKRTIYLSFGHDEEIGGQHGAASAVAYFKDNNIRMAWSLDEGSMILKDVIGGLKAPVASINVAEKGYLSLDIIARAEGGHSSLPPRDTAVSTLAKALVNLQSAPVPGGLSGVSREFFQGLGPHFSLVKRVLFANMWFYQPVLEMVLSGSPATDAMMRTTKAPTMLAGSAKDNILPQEAIATVNYRIHPRDSIQSVIEHTRAMIDNPEIEIKMRDGFGNEPSAVSDKDGAGFKALSNTFQQVFGDLIVVPGLTVAATDSVHYSQVSDDSYRINPFVFTGEDIKRLHGRNERISVQGMGQAVQFYSMLIRNAAG